MRTLLFGVAALALVAACGSGGDDTSGGGGEGAAGSTGSHGATGPATTGTATTGSHMSTTGAGASTSTGTTTTVGSGGGAAVCDPAAGTATVQADCDLLQLAVLQHDGAPTELLLTGRVFATSGGSSPTCALIDGVDVVQGQAGSTVIQHLDGGTSFSMDGEEHTIAHADTAASDFVGKCASDDASDRFNGYGIVVHGRVDGGSFTAACAEASFEGRWPPALRLTCHDNVDAPPAGADATEMTQSFMGMTFTTGTLYADSPHDAGGALTSADDHVFVIPLRDPFDPGMPIASHDTSGWMGTVSEQPYLGGTASQFDMLASTDVLGPDLCPPPQMMNPPMYGPPVFLARVTGAGQHGTYSTEIFVGGCIDEDLGSGP